MSEGHRYDWDRLLQPWLGDDDADLPGTRWVTLAEASHAAGVSRSALRTWYRTGQVVSRLVPGQHGPQRLVPLDAVIDRARRSPAVQRRAAQAASVEGELAALRRRVDELEARLAAVEDRP